eukprot:6933683-Pyramimonas_sp.AAC.1
MALLLRHYFMGPAHGRWQFRWNREYVPRNGKCSGWFLGHRDAAVQKQLKRSNSATEPAPLQTATDSSDTGTSTSSTTTASSLCTSAGSLEPWVDLDKAHDKAY